jgi:type IV pilus assembly protein PilW
MNPAKPARQAPARANRGFTMIELLVALTIGLALMIVVAQLFLGSRATYATTDDLSRMQENIRFSQTLLARTVHLAGYRTAPNSIVGNVFAGANAALAATNGAGTASDTLTVRYQGHNDGGGAADGSILDCLGNRVAANVTVANTFSIAPGANGNNALFCNGVELVADVENMQIVFGEDTNADLTADRYVSLPDVANMNSVVSVRIALLYETTGPAAAATMDTKTYNLNGVVVGPFNDLRIRRVVITTFNLRNRTP